jgi:serine/threonine protein kinase
VASNVCQALFHGTTRASDVWALGVFLFEITAGYPPFKVGCCTSEEPDSKAPERKRRFRVYKEAPGFRPDLRQDAHIV